MAGDEVGGEFGCKYEGPCRLSLRVGFHPKDDGEIWKDFKWGMGYDIVRFQKICVMTVCRRD